MTATSTAAVPCKIDAQARSIELKGELRTATVTDFPQFLEMESEWNGLAARSGVAHPFLGHSWVRSWWESFGDGRQLHIVAVENGRELAGLAPLMLSNEKIYGIPVRVLGSVYNDHTPRVDFLAAHDREAVAEAVWNHVWDARDTWDVVKLCQFEQDSPTLEAVTRLARQNGCHVGIWPSNSSPYLEIEGSFEQLLASRPRGMRANIRRRLKRLEEIGASVEFERVTNPDDLDCALADAFRMEASTWKGSEGTAIVCQEDTSRFYAAVARRAMEDGTLYFTFLRQGDRRIAFDLSLIYNERLFKLKPGYVQDLHACSPGQQLTVRTIRDAFERGLKEVDFLGSADEWKLEWTKDVRRNVWVFIFKSNVFGSLLHLAKFRIAPRIAEWRRSGQI